MATNVEALKNLYVAQGGQLEDVSDVNTNAGMVNALAGYAGLKETGVQAEKGTVTVFNKKVSALQSDVVVADNAITGTLKFISGGLAESGPLAGDGNFLALKFIDNNEADSIKVGLVPSASGMDLVEVIGDPDMNGVFKITGLVGGVQQVFKVVTTKDGVAKTQTFDLTGLILNEE